MLGYRLVDDELPRHIGVRLGMPAEMVETIENRAPGFGERLLAGLAGASPETAAPARIAADDLVGAYKREAERLIHAAASAGDVVILGRLGSAVLGARSDLVRCFVYAPLAWRIANVSASFGCSEAIARGEIARIDDARRTFAREHYRLAWGDLRNYDLAVDSARYGVEGAARVIACAVRIAATA